MISVKQLKDFLQGVPDDADIYVPSRKNPDEWDELTSLQINHDGDYTMIIMNE